MEPCKIILTRQQSEAIYLIEALDLWFNIIGYLYVTKSNTDELLGRIFKNGSVWVNDCRFGQSGKTEKYTLYQIRNSDRPLVRFG